MYKSVLVPIDLAHTERAAKMFEEAKKLCAPDGAITVAHIVPGIPKYVAAEIPAEVLKNSEAAALEELRGLTKASEVSATIVVRSGIPANTCLAIAEEKGCDLIIVASHDPGIADYFLGSTAARIVRHAHCSVLVMR